MMIHKNYSLDDTNIKKDNEENLGGFKMNDWEILKARYGSNRQYLNRSLSLCGGQWDDFKNYLIDQGADVFDLKIQNEDFRFKLNGSLGIVYEKGSGNLLAHNMAAEFHRSIGQDSMELYLKDKYYSNAVNS